MVAADPRGHEVDEVDRLIDGYLTPERATEIVSLHPAAERELTGWIRDSMAAQDWERCVRLANLGAHVAPPGFAEVLRDLIDLDEGGLNYEDLVEILGDIGASDSADSVFALVGRKIQDDAPAYWLVQKCIQALGEFRTPPADGYLRELTAPKWPDVVRWHAAVELQIEDDLGFSEEEMLGGGSRI